MPPATPERVSHLLLCGAFARGALRRNPSPQQIEATEAMIKLVEFGWGQSDPAFLQMFTSQFFPQATLAQAHSFNEIQRHAASPRVAARLIRAFAELDVSAELAPRAGAHARLSQPRRQPGAVRRRTLRRDIDRRGAFRAAGQQQPRALAGRARL